MVHLDEWFCFHFSNQDSTNYEKADFHLWPNRNRLVQIVCVMIDTNVKRSKSDSGWNKIGGGHCTEREKTE